MDSIRIESGVKQIAINGDHERVIEFNPSDIAFAERFYSIIQDFEGKLEEYRQRSAEFENDATLDEHGIPANIEARFALLREACQYMRGKVDYVFGAGTSQKTFGDTIDLNLFEQFFDGITPFVAKAREKKIVKYTQGAKGRVMK